MLSKTQISILKPLNNNFKNKISTNIFPTNIFKQHLQKQVNRHLIFNNNKRNFFCQSNNIHDKSQDVLNIEHRWLTEKFVNDRCYKICVDPKDTTEGYITMGIGILSVSVICGFWAYVLGIVPRPFAPVGPVLPIGILWAALTNLQILTYKVRNGMPNDYEGKLLKIFCNATENGELKHYCHVLLPYETIVLLLKIAREGKYTYEIISYLKSVRVQITEVNLLMILQEYNNMIKDVNQHFKGIKEFDDWLSSISYY